MPSVEKIRQIHTACLATPESETVKWVHGIMLKQSFDTAHLESHKQVIVDQLCDLPPEFYKNEGGGWSFLNACLDKDGQQWADMHQDMDALFCLGRAIGIVEYGPSDRSLWKTYPGGMPYVRIDLPIGK